MDNGASSYRRFLDGDKSAFDEIVNEYFHALVFFINGYVHDVYASEDIAIEIFSDLFAYRKYNFKASLKTYLFMRGKSKAIDYIRKNRSRAELPLSEASENVSEEEGLEEKILDSERKKKISKAIEGLPEQMRFVIHLAYFEDMSYKEIAMVMKIKPKQVDNLLYRAKKELRERLLEDGELF